MDLGWGRGRPHFSPMPPVIIIIIITIIIIISNVLI